MYALVVIDSNDLGDGTGICQFQWNTAPLTNTNVTVSATTGTGFVNQTLHTDTNAILTPTYSFLGVVPGSIAATGTITVNAVLTLAGGLNFVSGHDVWQFYAKARCR